jgi:hypothetical protein
MALKFSLVANVAEKTLVSFFLRVGRQSVPGEIGLMQDSPTMQNLGQNAEISKRGASCPTACSPLP